MTEPLPIPGLDYLPEFVSTRGEQILLQAVDAHEWLGDLGRRVQHYGYRYDYKARRIDESLRVGDLPQWLADLAGRLVRAGIFAEAPDQVIVNEYLPGQGISAHTDCAPCFGDTVASLSLGSGCCMDFTRADTRERISLWLEPRSLVVLKGDARYRWRHDIAKRLKDVVDGRAIERRRRVSLTFRNVQRP